MWYYIRLQYTLLNRHIRDFGLPPWAGYGLSVLAFIGLSVFLFYKTELAEYLYGFMAFMLLLYHGNPRRNEWLKSHYPAKQYWRIRLVENVLIATPFLFFLLYKQCYVTASILFLGAFLAAWVNIGQKTQFTLPTPFFRYPHEFTVGFRTSFLLILFAYFLTGMSIRVENFNLGAFSLLLIFLLMLGFYGTLEDKFFVWMHAALPKAFLWKKLRTGWAYSTLLSLPITLSLLLYYPEFWAILMLVQGLGYLYLSSMILAKYANFPHPIGLPQSIVIGIAFCFPPLMLWLIPYLFSQSAKRLQDVLS